MKYPNYSPNYSANKSSVQYKQYKDNKILCIIISTLLLALVCVGAAELAFARVAAPELYHQVTDPVIAVAQTGYAKAADAAKGAAAMLEQAADTASTRIVEAAATQMALLPEEAQLPEEAVPLSELPAADPVVTDAYAQDQNTYLTGGSLEVVYYYQKGEQWADQPYGTDDIGGYGCGPTSMAMIVSSLRQETVDPVEMADFCYKSGYWAKGQGSYLSIVNGVADAYSLNCTALAPNQLNKETLLTHLAGGDLAVALMHKGHFTTGGHFIVLRGVTLEGQILVADPNSLERSLVPWDPEIILNELSSSRSSGAPLWLLSAN